MSERMNKERAKEELRDRKILAEIEYNQSEDAKKKDNLLRYIKALDIAIGSLETRYQMNDKGEITPIDNEWVDVKDRLPSESGEYLVQWEVDVIKNIEWAVYKDNKWIAVRDSLNITPKVVAWKKVEPYKRKE